MKEIDITGPIYTGMWSMGPPFPKFELKSIKQPEWLEDKVFNEEFKGICNVTGTYILTPAHFLGYDKSYPLIDVDFRKLLDIKTYIIKLKLENLPEVEGRRAITKEAILDSLNGDKIVDCKAILVSTGWGKQWKSANYLDSSPFFKKEAIKLLISKGLFLLGSDSPRWENLKKMEGFFPMFSRENILILGPCINLEKINKRVVKLIVLPLKVEKTCAAPCRAIVIEE